MRGVLWIPVWAALGGLLMCAANPEPGMTIRLAVPKQVAAQAAARAAGDASSPPPVLMLEDLEVGNGEGLTLRVLGPAEPGSSGPRPVLAVSATVGSPQKVPAAPVQHLTLAIPLNEKASRLLKGKSEVTLTLEVEDSPGRTLRLKRAYFHTEESKPFSPH